jgi:hypothetical protein
MDAGGTGGGVDLHGADVHQDEMNVANLSGLRDGYRPCWIEASGGVPLFIHDQRVFWVRAPLEVGSRRLGRKHGSDRQYHPALTRGCHRDLGGGDREEYGHAGQ